MNVNPVLPRPLLTPDVCRLSLNVELVACYARESLTGEERFANVLLAIPEKPVDTVSGPDLLFSVDVESA